MPKYIPTNEDLYSTKPCYVCGRDVIDDSETCSDFCEQQWQSFKDDWEFMQLERLMKEEI